MSEATRPYQHVQGAPRMLLTTHIAEVGQRGGLGGWHLRIGQLFAA